VLCGVIFPKDVLLAHMAEELNNYRYGCMHCPFKCIDYYAMVQHQLDNEGHRCEEKSIRGKEWLTQLLYTASMHGKRYGMYEVYKMVLRSPDDEVTRPQHSSSSHGSEWVGTSSATCSHPVSASTGELPGAKRRARAEITFEGVPIRQGEVVLEHASLNASVDTREEHTCHLCGETFKSSPAQREHVALAHGDDLPNCPCPVSGCRWKGSKSKNTGLKHLLRSHGYTGACHLDDVTKARWDRIWSTFSSLIEERIYRCFPNFTDTTRPERGRYASTSATGPSAQGVEHKTLDEAIAQLVHDESQQNSGSHLTEESKGGSELNRNTDPSPVSSFDWFSTFDNK